MEQRQEALQPKEEQKIAMRVSRNSIIVNVLLSAGKLLAGTMAHSGAMISDAVHSASDVFSTFIVIIGVRIAGKKPDKQHPYGHERMECVAAIVLAVVLLATGLIIGYQGLANIVGGQYEKLAVPGMMALVAAVISIIVKEWMYWYTVAAANKIHSAALKADAWHHRSDALSSVGALIGIGGARLGYAVLDSVASVVIAVFIAKAAYDIFMDAVDKMVDKSCDEETEERMRALIMEQSGVLGITSFQTRMFGSKIYVDAEIEADGELTLREGHDIAEKVHAAIEREFVRVKHCMVHVNPYGKEQLEDVVSEEAGERL